MSLQIQVHEISGQVQAGSIAGLEFANRVNKTVNRSLDGLAEAFGKEDFQRFCEWTAGEKIVLVNPEIARRPYSSFRTNVARFARLHEPGLTI